MESKKASSVAWAWPWKEGSPWVCSWSLNACAVRISKEAFGKALDLPDLQLLTPAQAANALALYGATLWLGVAGAGAALLALLLEGRARRTHRALAGVALASAAAIHCVQACLLGVELLTDVPCESLLGASVTLAVCVAFFATFDVNAARVLLRRPPGGEGEEEKQAAALQEKQSKNCLALIDQESGAA